jgi:hypothetical protein
MPVFGHNIYSGKLIATMAALMLLCATVTGKTEQAQQTEYRIKTAFLYNFSRFVVWPESVISARSEFSLCTLGETLFEEQLDTLIGKTVHNKAIVVKHYSRLQEVLHCQLVFIGDKQDLTRIFWTLQGQPVLTVSNIAGFTEKGGMIQFQLVENKIRFRINADAATSAGLTVSSKLLSLAFDASGSR